MTLSEFLRRNAAVDGKEGLVDDLLLTPGRSQPVMDDPDTFCFDEVPPVGLREQGLKSRLHPRSRPPISGASMLMLRTPAGPCGPLRDDFPMVQRLVWSLGGLVVPVVLVRSHPNPLIID